MSTQLEAELLAALESAECIKADAGYWDTPTIHEARRIVAAILPVITGKDDA